MRVYVIHRGSTPSVGSPRQGWAASTPAQPRVRSSIPQIHIQRPARRQRRRKWREQSSARSQRATAE